MVIRFNIIDSDLEYEGDNPTTTSQAMDISIAKWKFIVNHIQYMIDSEEQYAQFGCGGIKTCGLCMMFINNPGKAYCQGCPVFQKTGRSGCEGTPFDDWVISASISFENDLILAKRELEFLQQIKYDRNL